MFAGKSYFVTSRKYCVQIYFVESRYQKNLLKSSNEVDLLRYLTKLISAIKLFTLVKTTALNCTHKRPMDRSQRPEVSSLHDVGFYRATYSIARSLLRLSVIPGIVSKRLNPSSLIYLKTFSNV